MVYSHTDRSDDGEDEDGDEDIGAVRPSESGDPSPPNDPAKRTDGRRSELIKPLVATLTQYSQSVADSVRRLRGSTVRIHCVPPTESRRAVTMMTTTTTTAMPTAAAETAVSEADGFFLGGPMCFVVEKIRRALSHSVQSVRRSKLFPPRVGPEQTVHSQQLLAAAAAAAATGTVDACTAGG